MKPELAGVLTFLVITVGILGGCKSRVAADQKTLSQQTSPDGAASAAPPSEEKSNAVPHKDDDPGNATETVTKFYQLSGLHSGLSQDDVMPYVKRYFGLAPYRGGVRQE